MIGNIVAGVASTIVAAPVFSGSVDYLVIAGGGSGGGGQGGVGGGGGGAGGYRENTLTGLSLLTNYTVTIGAGGAGAFGATAMFGVNGGDTTFSTITSTGGGGGGTVSGSFYKILTCIEVIYLVLLC